MAETTGLLNRRTFNRVPGVRIPLSPQDVFRRDGIRYNSFSGCSAVRLAHPATGREGRKALLPMKKAVVKTAIVFEILSRDVAQSG